MEPWRETYDEIKEKMDSVAGDQNISRQQYREFLQEIQMDCESALNALDDDDQRDEKAAEGDE